MQQDPLFRGVDPNQAVPSESESESQSQSQSLAPPRLRRADREQVLMEPLSLEQTLPPDHPARAVWAAVCALDWSAFEAPVLARGEGPGRAATDPRVPAALWLYAAVDGVGSGRHLAELCLDHAAYRWIRGGVPVCYHTLNDFRTGHGPALDELFTQVLGRLVNAGVVDAEVITQDSTVVRASAGRSSFHREATLEKDLAAAREHLAALKREVDDAPEASKRRREQRRAAREHAARDRVRRVEEAMAHVRQVGEAKAAQKDKPSKHEEPRASSTDPEARVMKAGDGGYAPGYSVQLAQDPATRAVVGVDVTNAGDKGRDVEMRQQVRERTGREVKAHVVDGNYFTHAAVDAADAEGVALYAPLPEARKQGQDRYARRKGDSDAVAEFRERMGTAEGQELYKLRCRTCETVNADVKEHRGLRAVRVRGLVKVLAVATWHALAYNLMHFGAAVVAAAAGA